MMPLIHSMLKRPLLITLTLLSMLLLSSCGDNDDTNVAKTITMGFGPSTYVDQFEKGIRPILEAKGFKVNVRIVSQNSQLNPSMKEGAIDATVFQSRAYMESVNPILKMNMVKLADTASAPQSLRSTRHSSLDAVKNGMTVTIPQDPVNGERAARLLESLGWITIDENAEIATFSAKSILPGNYTLSILEIDPAQSLRTLEDVDFAIVNGNYIANAGLKMSDGLALEATPEEHVVIVSIRGEDLDTEWAKALKAAYESDEFRDYIHSEPLYDGFIMPKAWNQE